MSRHLPSQPNLEYLKKQAKDLLADLARTDATAQLADAQRQLARDYGFATWAALKAHVLAAAAPAPIEEPGRVFVGRWQADLARSTRPRDNLYRSAALEFEVRGNAVTIIDVVVDESGRSERNSNVLVVDGLSRPQRYGYAITARWVTPRRLEAEMTNDGQPRGRVSYVVDADGRTLTLATADSVSVFDRAV
jgi:hypothetical protein